jgi:hypothetical protein
MIGARYRMRVMRERGFLVRSRRLRARRKERVGPRRIDGAESDLAVGRGTPMSILRRAPQSGQHYLTAQSSQHGYSDFCELAQDQR